MKRIVKLVLVLTVVIGIGLGIGAGKGGAIPQLINYHGRLTDSSGVPINGIKSMTFRLYDVASEGNNLWTETQSVAVNNGLYNVKLGNTTALTPSIFANNILYLGIKVESDSEMTPRTQILAVGYAFRAATAEAALTLTGTANVNTTGTATLGALTVDTNTLYVDAANNRVGIGTMEPDGTLVVNGQIRSTGSSAGLTFKNRETGSNGYQWHTSDNKARLYAMANNTQPLVIDSTGNVGIGTTEPATKLEIVTAVSASPLTYTGALRISAAWPQIDFVDSDDADWVIHVNNDNMYIGTDNAGWDTKLLLYNNGNVNVEGTLSKGAGSFLIDHPLDPQNKILRHSFIESPDMKNIYDGIAVFDENGETAVELPNYFGALNKDFRYQLTSIGKQMDLYVKQEIENNKFVIAGGRKGKKVSWQVTGIRQDAFAKANRIIIEEEKGVGNDFKKGEYIHADCFTSKVANK